MEETRTAYSIENTKQALEAFLDLLIIMIPKFHDGVQVQDFVELASKIMADEELKAKMIKAYNDIELVPKEMSDLEVAEILDLISLVVAKAPAILAALRR
jgi:hypothetical protein